MITFTCRCRHLFRLDESEAGGLVQCPRCGLLNDIPTLGDLPNLAEDGTYKLDTTAPPEGSAERVAELRHVFTRSTTDDLGREIDLRLTPEQIARAGVSTGPIPTGIAAVGNRPRYDPETGELIRPLEIKPDPSDQINPATIPLARATVNYAPVGLTGDTTPRWAMLRLLMPINILVMFIIFALHVVVQLIVGFFFGAGIVLISPALFILQFLIIAHYGNVIDEIGPCGNDELPRFLRDLRFGEDIWGPMSAMLGSVFLCYAPALLCAVAVSAGPSWFLVLAISVAIVTLLVVMLRLTISILPLELNQVLWKDDVFVPIGMVIVILAVAIGPAAICCVFKASDASMLATGGTLAIGATVVFPGVVLTLATSGSAVNVRPDRVIECIGICGRRYLVPLLAWVVAAPLYFLGLVFASTGVMGMISGATKLSAWTRIAGLTMPALMLGIYGMHLFCWEIGMLYRLHHEQFPWLFQRHAKRDPMPIRRALAQTPVPPR